MTRVLGVDFSSAPTARKPIVVAIGDFESGTVAMREVVSLPTLHSFEEFLRGDSTFVGGFDFPFGLPREFLESADDLPTTFLGVARWLRETPKEAIRDRFRAFMHDRPVGSKFAHRASDRLAGSSSSMKWVNPPVAWMCREGVSRLVDAGLDLPGLHRGDPGRVALEAYPSVVARAITHASYKSDERGKQTSARRDERIRIVAALEDGRPLGVAMTGPEALRSRAIEDASGDTLDAMICALQAAKASTEPGYGIPPDVDPLEGFIVGVPRAD